jgi:hypothetical protein
MRNYIHFKHLAATGLPHLLLPLPCRELHDFWVSHSVGPITSSAATAFEAEEECELEESTQLLFQV